MLSFRQRLFINNKDQIIFTAIFLSFVYLMLLISKMHSSGDVTVNFPRHQKRSAPQVINLIKQQFKMHTRKMVNVHLNIGHY